MPKVTEEYIINKKKMITDAAFELCVEKTVSTVTMQDIINRTGLSQGGIYRFYHDIDEIFADMLAEMKKKFCIKDKVDEIFAQADDIPVGEVMNCIFDMLTIFLSEELMEIEKVDFELYVLSMNAPKRVAKILKGANGVGNKEYILFRTSEFLKQKIESGEVHAKVDGTELLKYMASAYSGIQTNCIVNHCYHKATMSEFYKPKEQIQILAKTVNYLLGVDE